MNPIDHAKLLLLLASKDLKALDIMMMPDSVDDAIFGFHAQQAFEKTRATAAKRSAGQRFAGPYVAPGFSPKNGRRSVISAARLNLAATACTSSVLTTNLLGMGSGFAPRTAAK